jgi:hypothetical protein
MSYVLLPVVIDIPALEAAVGSKDQALIDAIMAHDPDYYKSDLTDDGARVTPGMAIHHLVMGKPLNEDYAHEYGYALSAMCSHMGEVIVPKHWAGVGWDVVDRCGLEVVMTETGPPVPLPPIDNFPMIGHIRRADLESHLEAARERRRNASDDSVIELIDEYIQWLDDAQRKSLDVVFFYH